MTTQNKESLSFLGRLALQMDKNAADEAMKKRIAGEARKDMQNVIRKQEDAINGMLTDLGNIDTEISSLEGQMSEALCPQVVDGKSSFSAMTLVNLKNKIDKKKVEASKLKGKIVAAQEGLKWLKTIASELFQDLDVQDLGDLLNKY